MSVLKKKSGFKDISIKKDFSSLPEELDISKLEFESVEFVSNDEKKSRGRPKKQSFDKRDCTYTFYCTKEELQSIQVKAKEKHLTLAEYFRVRLLLD